MRSELRTQGWGLRGFGLMLGILLSACTNGTSPTEAITPEAPVSPNAAPPALTYDIYDLPGSTVHVVTVPSGGEYQVGVAASASLESLPVLAEGVAAIAAINGGFFDPQNGLTTSPITLEGTLAQDPRHNPRLMDNPDLHPYLDQILDRSEFRIYDCGGTVQYAIARHRAPVSTGCTLDSAVGAGPQLLPTLTGVEEAFLTENAQGEVVRDALGSRSPNARSAIGLKADGTVVLAMASQRADIPAPTGLTLQDLADFLAQLEVVAALNLDGGSSSGLYVEGRPHYGRLDAENIPIERPIKSILFIR